MILTRVCGFDGKTYTMEIPKLNEELLRRVNDRHRSGEMIQHIVPMLTADEREFLMTGTPPEVWDRMFKDA